MHKATKVRPLSAWILMFCGIWLIGLGLYFVFLRPPLLPEAANPFPKLARYRRLNVKKIIHEYI
jgi:hypothetical protein